MLSIHLLAIMCLLVANKGPLVASFTMTEYRSHRRPAQTTFGWQQREPTNLFDSPKENPDKELPANSRKNSTRWKRVRPPSDSQTGFEQSTARQTRWKSTNSDTSTRNDLTSTVDGEPVVQQTIAGGTAMIFEMARRMLWENTVMDDYNRLQQEQDLQQAKQRRRRRRQEQQELLGGPPRWHPTAGISDVNPQFRTQAPVMNSLGYAGTIWRNVRKRAKPSMWRYALRTYDRMTTVSPLDDPKDKPLRVERTNIHHEGALVACAKLGMWERALEIYSDVRQQQLSEARRDLPDLDKQQQAQLQPLTSEFKYRNPSTTPSSSVYVTDNMILSVIRACVKAARKRVVPPEERQTVQERRRPLDAAVRLLRTDMDDYNLPLVARHVNPIAAAYQSMGLFAEATHVIDTLLTERTSGPEEEDGEDPFNLHDVQAKDKGSYTLLVQGAVSKGDWGDAVDALRSMTESGLYPNSRHLNAWTEVSERKSRHRMTRSWTKKRDEYWLENVQ